MDNIDVLLKAAEYIESQESTSNDSNVHTHLNIEPSLSPISSASYSSSSSSSLFNSPNSSNNVTCQNGLKGERAFHKKFNNKKMLNLESNSSLSNESKINFSYSSSLPNSLISPPSFSRAKKNDVKSSSNTSLSRSEELKRDKQIHNTLEKNRRAHLKECFENLQNELPQYKDKKCTNLAILNYTLKFVEQSKKKDKENEIEKARLLKKQLFLKQRLKNLVLDFKNQYLQSNSDDIDDEANSKFSSFLQNIGIDPNDSFFDNNNNNQINIEDFDENLEIETEFSSNQNFPSAYNGATLETSPKEIVNKYHRKRSSNSMSTIIDLKTLQPTQSLQLQLQNQLKLQKQLGKRITGQRHRHYSVDDTIINRQRQRKKTLSICKNELDANLDDGFDDDDDFSIDETNTTADLDMDSNSMNYDDRDGENTRTAIDDDESRDLIINEDDDDQNDQNKSTNKEENIDVEALSEKSNSPISVRQPAKIVIQTGNNSIINGLNNRQSHIILNKPPSKVIANSTFTNGLFSNITPILNVNSQVNSFLKTNIVNRGSIKNGTSFISNLNLNTLKTSIQESTSNDPKSLNIKSLSVSPNPSLNILNMKSQEANKSIVKHLILNSNNQQQQQLNSDDANKK